ncbi:MAG: aldolase/citrate lyase family protein [Rhodobacteraceae bacterium]|nr:aldolase/citrate lyase family protein [Paracoccaceae bacterium]
MSNLSGFKQKMLSGEILAGTFLKTPNYILVEVLAQSKLDFICLDAEHSPFDRAALDQCLSISRALDFPVLVRVGENSAKEILWALDCGAVGLVIPHVDTVEKAKLASKSARYGLGGRGFAGSTRWAGYATEDMPSIIKRSNKETIVLAQIEEPAGVDKAAEIAAIDGIDGLFVGPADLSVGYGYDHQNSDELKAALVSVGEASRKADKAFVSFVPNPEKAHEWNKDFGVTVFFIASEHNWLRDTANSVADKTHEI